MVMSFGVIRGSWELGSDKKDMSASWKWSTIKRINWIIKDLISYLLIEGIQTILELMRLFWIIATKRL